MDKISISLRLRESTADKIEQLLENAYTLMLDDLINEEGSTVALNNLLNKEKKWLCKNCQST